MTGAEQPPVIDGGLNEYGTNQNSWPSHREFRAFTGSPSAARTCSGVRTECANFTNSCATFDEGAFRTAGTPVLLAPLIVRASSGIDRATRRPNATWASSSDISLGWP